MTPSPVWTITPEGIGGGSHGKLLVGCHIVLNAAQNAYEFTKPNINDVLTISSGTLLPVTFPVFSYKGFDWVVTLSTAQVGGTATGTWSIPVTEGSEAFTPDSGDYVAQTGLGAEEEKAASSGPT